MISGTDGRCLNFVTFSLKAEVPHDRQSKKEITHCLYGNANIPFINISIAENNDHQGEMRKDQLDLAEIWECSFLPSKVGASLSNNNGYQPHLTGF